MTERTPRHEPPKGVSLETYMAWIDNWAQHKCWGTLSDFSGKSISNLQTITASRREDFPLEGKRKFGGAPAREAPPPPRANYHWNEMETLVLLGLMRAGGGEAGALATAIARAAGSPPRSPIAVIHKVRALVDDGVLAGTALSQVWQGQGMRPRDRASLPRLKFLQKGGGGLPR